MPRLAWLGLMPKRGEAYRLQALSVRKRVLSVKRPLPAIVDFSWRPRTGLLFVAHELGVGIHSSATMSFDLL
jgi:hypothetical protein